MEPHMTRIFSFSFFHAPQIPISEIVYTTSNSPYLLILESTIENLGFSTPTTIKPLIIVRPLIDSLTQATVIRC